MISSGKIVVDTDVLIDFFRGHPDAIAYINQHEESVHISSVTITELFSGVKSQEEVRDIENLMDLVHIIDVNKKIARDSGLIRRKYTKSHGTGIIDAIIASTALHHEIPLATLNEKHYPMIEDLIVPYRKE